MQHEHRGLEPYCVDGSIRTPIPILRNLQDTSGTKALERFGLLVLLAHLSEVECESKQILDRLGRNFRIPLCTPNPAKRLRAWGPVHRYSHYTHIGIESSARWRGYLRPAGHIVNSARKDGIEARRIVRGAAGSLPLTPQPRIELTNGPGPSSLEHSGRQPQSAPRAIHVRSPAHPTSHGSCRRCGRSRTGG